MHNERSQSSTSGAAITAIEYCLPVATLTNQDISRLHPEWSVERIFEKTGIAARHVAASDQTASDLGVAAAEKLFRSGICRPQDIDLLVFCTQTPDYAIPTTACIIQNRLRLPTSCAAFDLNLGCSGFVYGLSVVKGILESQGLRKAILITAETYSKWLAPEDKSVRTIFGDAGVATLIELPSGLEQSGNIGPFVFGTDGSGAQRLVVPNSGARKTAGSEPGSASGQPGYLYMDGPEVFSFTTRTVPRAVQDLLERSQVLPGDIDLYVFHQANAYMLDHLRKRCGIPPEKFVTCIENYGNTVSCTIPIAIKDCCESGRLRAGMRIAVVGFGVGYSWAAALLRWRGCGALPGAGAT